MSQDIALTRSQLHNPDLNLPLVAISANKCTALKNSNGQTYQSFDLGFQFLLSFLDGFLLSDDRDHLLVVVLSCGEDNACTSAFTKLLDISSIASDQESMVFWLSFDLLREAILKSFFSKFLQLNLKEKH